MPAIVSRGMIPEGLREGFAMRISRPMLALFVILPMIGCSSRTGRTGQGNAAATAAGAKAPITIADAGVNPAADATAANVPRSKDQVLRLTLTDEKSLVPVYHAGLNLAGSTTLQWTDRSGRSQWQESIPVVGSIDIRCPALRAETGRKIKSITYALTGHQTEVSATINAAECVEPPEKSTTGNYKGIFHKYYDHGAFVPCDGLPADAGFYGTSKSAWVNFSASTAGEFQDLSPTYPGAAENGLYVEWTGALTGPGAYGHLGFSAYKFDVSHIDKVSKEPPGSCAGGNSG